MNKYTQCFKAHQHPKFQCSCFRYIEILPIHKSVLKCPRLTHRAILPLMLTYTLTHTQCFKAHRGGKFKGSCSGGVNIYPIIKHCLKWLIKAYKGIWWLQTYIIPCLYPSYNAPVSPYKPILRGFVICPYIYISPRHFKPVLPPDAPIFRRVPYTLLYVYEREGYVCGLVGWLVGRQVGRLVTWVSL